MALKILDPRKLSADAVLADQQQWDPALCSDDDHEVMKELCRVMYSLSVDEYREYMCNRAECK